MIPLPDIDAYPVLDWPRFEWLLKAGVSAQTLIDLAPLHVATGRMASDGCFEDDREGQSFILFPEAEDAVFWQPRTGELATWSGRAFALGEDALYNPGTYAFDGNLNLLPDPLEWLRCSCDGIVVLDWKRAWSRLQDAPRLAVHETLIFQYRRHMQPPRGPETVVLVERRAVA